MGSIIIYTVEGQSRRLALAYLRGKLLEEIDMDKGLRQGYCMAQYYSSCVYIHRLDVGLLACYIRRVGRVPGVVKYKYDGKLFRKCTRNTMPCGGS